MATDSTIVNTTLPHRQKVKTGRNILFILALVASMATAHTAMAETLFMQSGKVHHGVTVISETKDAITVKQGNIVTDIPARHVKLVLHNGMKVYVARRDGIGFTAFFRNSGESGYTFARGLNGDDEFTVGQTEIYCISTKTPGDLKPGLIQFQTLGVIDIVSAAALFQGFFLAFMLFRRNTVNRRANRILALFVINASIAICGYNFLIYLFPEYTHLQIILFYLHWSTRYAAGPLLYFYVLALVSPRFKPSLRHVAHFVPACFAGSYYLLMDLPLSCQQLAISFDYKSTYNFFTGMDIVIGDGAGVQLCIYVLLALRFLARHSRRVQDLFSSTEKLNLSWLAFILRFMLGICAVYITALTINSILLVIDFNQYWSKIDDVLSLSLNSLVGLVAVLVYTIGYRALVQPEIFAGIPDDLLKGPDEPDQKMSLSPEKAREIMDRVIKVMDEDRPYLDPGLTLPMLADMAGVSRNLLSQAINERTGQNFYEFVNFYRVETAKEYLKDPEKREMNVLHIAFDAGFNTKATFNSVFKKNTGLTPTEYRKNFEAADGAAMPETATMQ